MMTPEQRDEIEGEFFARYDSISERFGGLAAIERDRLIEVINDRLDAEESEPVGVGQKTRTSTVAIAPVCGRHTDSDDILF